MRLHLGGHLAFYHPQKSSWMETELAQEQRLTKVLNLLNIPIAEIALVVINGKPASLEDAMVSDQDKVEIFPPIGGGC